MTNNDELKELKSRFYDTLVVSQTAQATLTQLSQQIAQKEQELAQKDTGLPSQANASAPQPKTKS